MEPWEARRLRGYPIREDWEAGRCLSPTQLAELQDGERVSVVWGGGNGPYTYTAKRRDGYVLACSPGLGDGYPGDLYSPFYGTDAKALPLWVERA